MKVYLVEWCDDLGCNGISFVTDSKEKAAKKLNEMGFFENEYSAFINPREGQTWLDGEKIGNYDWLSWSYGDERLSRVQTYDYDYYNVTEYEVV